jgi:DNA-binding transcriptional regulator YiaG
MTEIPTPAPAEIKAARESAGDTQAQAAARVWAGSYRTWQDWETGRRPVGMAEWELYLIKTGQLDSRTACKPDHL